MDIRCLSRPAAYRSSCDPSHNVGNLPGHGAPANQTAVMLEIGVHVARWWACSVPGWTQAWLPGLGPLCVLDMDRSLVGGYESADRGGGAIGRVHAPGRRRQGGADAPYRREDVKVICGSSEAVIRHQHATYLGPRRIKRCASTANVHHTEPPVVGDRVCSSKLRRWLTRDAG